MKDFINIQSINELKIIDIPNGEVCKIPLLHGTRRYALQATKEERGITGEGRREGVQGYHRHEGW